MSNLGKRHPRNPVSTSRRPLIGALAITLGLLVSVVGGAASAREFSMTPNVPYMHIDGRDVYLDIYTPSSEGPWPVVVAFHGMGARDARTTYDVATAAASQGMLVVTPAWLDGHSFPITPDVIDMHRHEASCAIAFAQQQAIVLGGDPERTVAYGFSAGLTPAMAAALAPVEGSIPGCATDAPAAPVAGVVAGEGDYFMYTGTFDEAFDGDAVGMAAQAAKFVDPSAWPADLDASFFLWTAGDGSEPRTLGDPDDESDFLALRDPSGSIRADLERLGQLEDGVITLVDAGRLMADRLASAGIDVTLDEYPGGHTTLDKVPELIGAMQAAAGE